MPPGLCSLAGRYDNPIPTRFLIPMDCLKIPAQIYILFLIPDFSMLGGCVWQVCEILLENGADVDHADKEGKMALFAAASMGHLEILNILLFWGCYVDGIGEDQ